jgi:signal transduction histidine kinase
MKQATLKRKQIEEDLKNAKIAARNVLEDLQVEKDMLAGAKAKDEAMLASIGDGVIIVDLAGKITFMNRVAKDLLGWKDAESIGALLFDVVPIENEKGDLVEAPARPMAIALASAGTAAKAGEIPAASQQKSIPVLYYYVRKDKTRFPAAITVAPVLLNNTIVGAIEVFRDVTKEREIDRTKSEFVSLASHQLRTPLTTVNWYSEMLLKGGVTKNSKRQKEYLEKIHAGSGQMVMLINMLLNVSRIELGTLVVESKPANISALLLEVISEQKPQMDKKEITIKSTFSNDIPICKTDGNLLRTVFQNLLSNAIKYTEDRGHIDTSMSLDNEGNVLITFSDTGYGIPKKDHDHIFTKMFRADNVKEKGTEGTGLGLYIVKSVLTALGGSVRFESEENKGAKFFVTLPPA